MDDTTKETLFRWSNDGYDLLEKGNVDLLRNIMGDAGCKRAIRRMLAIFTESEDFEKCSTVQNILNNNFKGNVSPLYDYIDDFI